MNGKELFNKYTLLDRGDIIDQEYSQTLLTIFFNIGNAIYPLLERAEVENKKLAINENNLTELWDNFESESVMLC